MQHCRYCDRELPDEAFYSYDLEAGRSKCRECKRAYVSARYQQLSRKRKCYDCRRDLADSDKKLCVVCKASRRETWVQRYQEPQKKKAKDRRISFKLQAFTAYGGPVCRCCGDSHLEFLTIDHIYENGASHRRELPTSSRAGVGFYRWLKKEGFPAGYQVLCFNCNFAKGHFAECPHESERKLKRQEESPNVRFN